MFNKMNKSLNKHSPKLKVQSEILNNFSEAKGDITTLGYHKIKNIDHQIIPEEKIEIRTPSNKKIRIFSKKSDDQVTSDPNYN